MLSSIKKVYTKVERSQLPDIYQVGKDRVPALNPKPFGALFM